jgi:hypothetical protein
MKRIAVEKRMDFATFRRFLGASSMQLAEMTPQPGHMIDDPNSTITVSAKIPDFQSLDPQSVGMALLSNQAAIPYSYDPQSGSVTLTVKEALKGTLQRALVWATDIRSGKRVEATWTFRLPGEELPVKPVLGDPERALIPAEMLRPVATPGGGAPQASAGGAQRGGHDARVPRAPR